MISAKAVPSAPHGRTPSTEEGNGCVHWDLPWSCLGSVLAACCPPPRASGWRYFSQAQAPHCPPAPSWLPGKTCSADCA